MAVLKQPRIIVTAPKGGSGKTSFTVGLVRLLRKRSYRTAAFKKGPDYIDPGWLAAAAGRPAYNLDQFMMNDEVVLRSLYHHSKEADISVIEGNRGLYDGLDTEGTFSTAALSKLTKTPVLLVLDCVKMTRTAAAIVKGLQEFDPSVGLRAVVLNNVAGQRHEGILRSTIERYTDAKVVGVIGRMDKVPILMRHLGLTPACEHPEYEEVLETISELVKEGTDMERILEISKEAGEIEVPEGELFHIPEGLRKTAEGLKVVVLRDRAFQFYYPENIEALKKAGIEVLEVDATNDRALPQCDLVYIGGGFPETNAPRLSGNRHFMESLRKAVARGTAIYAECGGLMFLGKSLQYGDKHYTMTGILPVSFQMKSSPVAHGYTVVEVEGGRGIFPEGLQLRGHEFHYSNPVLEDREGFSFLFRMKKGKGIIDGRDGLLKGRVFGTYTHLHALGSPEWVEALVKLAGG